MEIWNFRWEAINNERQWKAVIPNRSLDSEQISLDCWADGFSLAWRRSGLRRERTRNKMPTRKWKMTGSYLLYNELHYNVLMTDLGLIPHRTIYSLFMQAKVVSRVALLMPFLFYPLLAVPSSLATLTDDTGHRTQGVQSHYQRA